MKAYLLVNDEKIILTYEQTTIGRLSTNLIPINDPTISKNHAAINYISSEDKFYLRDLGTVNGTYLNGKRLQSNKRQVLKHKDSIQFDSNLYGFFMSQPESERKGKINLKDYCFELESDDEKDKKESVIIRPPSNMKKSEAGGKNISSMGKEGKKLKIPNLADYLELSASLLSENNSNNPKDSNITANMDKYKSSKFSRQGKVSLPKMNNQFDDEDLQKVRKEEQNRRNIFLSKEAEKQARQEKARALEQSKIRLEIEKHKHEEEMLRKQFELESKIREEQQRMESEKRRIEEELLRREEERRAKEKQLEEEQREKQRKFVERLQQEKQDELRKIKNQEQLLRTRNETAMREQLQHKKKDLQLQAQALAQQYEQIYRETIRKMKNDIEKEENEIEQLQRNIQTLKQQNISLDNKHTQVIEAVAYAKKQFTQVSGRNKAFILYASELQDRLDRLRSQKAEDKQKRVSAKLKEQIINSRKLLFMKRNQIKTIQEEISKLKLTLSLGSKIGQSDMLETILSNHQAIQNCKSIYFQYLREEKSLQELWEQQLAQNQHLQQQNFALEKQVQNGKKQLTTNIKDNISRLTQQRIHMLKCLHYLPEDKKRAAKFLIEEMLTMEEEIRGMVIESEQSHDKIQELIVDTQRKKQENEYLSQLLFGADSTAHHFDNMKIEINTLIERLQLQRDDSRAMKRLKVADEIEQNQVAIHEWGLKVERLRNRWREGLQGQKMILAEKNPIVFFGDLLWKREADLEESELRIAKLEREHVELLADVEELQRKKGSLNDTLQRFKREQLHKVRQSLL